MVAADSTTSAADLLIPEDHPFRAHLRHAAELESATPARLWQSDDGPLPSLYVSHGAPPTFEDPAWMRQLLDWARSMPRPRAILIVSAHWESEALGITSTVPTELVYDFDGFGPMYHRMRYDTPDNSVLASQLLSVLPPELQPYEHRNRGLDHGAWVPLKLMYPEANVPVLQLSLPTHDPTVLFDLGQRLRTLRGEGVLIIGSGFMTHGLPYLDLSRPEVVPGWSAEFDQWAASALDRGDVEELASFRDRAPGLQYAHPTVEHFTPIFVTIGAASDPTARVTTAIDGFAYGLAKRSFHVD